jgi:4'-phosphopantetheinyl transferase
VDVEQVRPLEDMTKVSSHFFSREESEELLSLPPDERERAFFLCWTRKEAYVKAVGNGLSIPLDSFRVTLRPGEPSRFLHLDHDVSAAQAWTLHDLEMANGYAAALAYRDAPRPVQLQPLLGMEELLTLSSRDGG